MSTASLTQVVVRDLVPFGNPGHETSFFALRLSQPGWKKWQPGQFVMLRPQTVCHDALWGRPFSICHITNQDLVIFFQVVGRATRRLATLNPGDTLDIWGPLGTPLHVDPEKKTLLLAGGIGVAPFIGYVYTHPAAWNITLEFGHRVPLGCYPLENINEKITMGTHLERNDEDRQRFLSVINTRIQEHADNGLVLACGPMPFLRTVQEYARKHQAKAQLCLETTMACGIGACLGCVVKAASTATNASPQRNSNEFNYVQTCTCGPSFWADTVDLG